MVVSSAACSRSGRSLSWIVVHQEADRAAVHAVDRRAGRHEAVQDLQHVAVAAEGHHDIGAVRIGIAMAPGEAADGLAGFGRVGREEGDTGEFHAGFFALTGPV